MGNQLLYSDEQIESFANSFAKDLESGEMKKKDSPNQEALYCASVEQEDLEWVLSANPQAKLFKTAMKSN